MESLRCIIEKLIGLCGILNDEEKLSVAQRRYFYEIATTYYTWYADDSEGEWE